MYSYTIIDIERDKTTFTFDTFEELLKHFKTIEPYTQGSDPYYSVIGTISRNTCKI